MPNSSDYLSHAVTAAGVLTDKWFPSSAPGKWVPNDYWGTPVICTLLTELMTQTNQVDYTATLENARQAGEGPLTWCAYYDVLTWWGRFFVHAYNYFKSQSNSAMAKPYLADADIVCDQLSQGWDAWESPELRRRHLVDAPFTAAAVADSSDCIQGLKFHAGLYGNCARFVP